MECRNLSHSGTEYIHSYVRRMNEKGILVTSWPPPPPVHTLGGRKVSFIQDQTTWECVDSVCPSVCLSPIGLEIAKKFHLAKRALVQKWSINLALARQCFSLLKRLQN